MKSDWDWEVDWDWEFLRRAACQVGVVIMAAGIVDVFLGSRDIGTSTVLLPIGVVLLGLSCMRRCKMEPIVWVAFAAALPLIVLLLLGMYHNK
ncbi:MAG: hypothetical protein OD817_02020 [Gammaproteobacteria bacterium]